MDRPSPSVRRKTPNASQLDGPRLTNHPAFACAGDFPRAAPNTLARCPSEGGHLGLLLFCWASTSLLDQFGKPRPVTAV